MIAVAVRSVPPADHAVVEDRLVERHRNRVLRTEANRRIELVRRPRSAEARGCGRRPAGWRSRGGRSCRACAAEEVLERSRERFRVLDVALADHTRLERNDRGPSDAAAVLPLDLGGGDAAGLDVEPDEWMCSS